MATELWPDFQAAPRQRRWVREVLDRAGAELKQKTNGVVELRVNPYQEDDPFLPFGYECQLYIPKLDFVYLLFRLRTDATGSSVAIQAASRTDKDIFDAEQLQNALSELFHSDHTQQVVQNLLSLATE